MPERPRRRRRKELCVPLGLDDVVHRGTSNQPEAHNRREDDSHTFPVGSLLQEGIGTREDGARENGCNNTETVDVRQDVSEALLRGMCGDLPECEAPDAGERQLA
jgi:hypothetical protein